MKKSTLLVFLLIVLTLFTGCKKIEVTDEHKELLITYEDISDFIDYDLEVESCETYKGVKNLDGSIELDYEFDYEKNENNETPFYISSGIEFDRTVSDAKENFKIIVGAFKVGAFLGDKDVKIVKDDNLFSWGDESYCAYMELDEIKFGNIFAFRKENKIFTTIITGAYFDDKETTSDFLLEKLNAFSEYNFSDK